MKIQILSKSGNENAVIDLVETTLLEALKHLRREGGYLMDEKAVPFEEIRAIRKH